MLDTRKLLQPMVDKQIDQTKKGVALNVATATHAPLPSAESSPGGTGTIVDFRA
ncbi:MAG: hypothetical protein KIS92_21015 [Planctomycetota bacterium]|nr:hypothetical protein [Planctomycetota bacterium]